MRREANPHRDAWLKAVVLLILLIAAFLIARSPTVRPHLTAEGFSAFLDGLGPWAPVVYVIVFGIIAALPIPATILVVAGAALFGLWLGFALAILGMTIAAGLALLLARSLGRDLARRLSGDILRKYDARLSERGLRTVIYLRLLLIPFAPANYAAGLSSVRVRDYLLGTAIGIMPAVFFTVFFAAAVREVVLEYGIFSVELLRSLLRWDVLLAAALLLLCFATPSILERLSRRSHKHRSRRH